MMTIIGNESRRAKRIENATKKLESTHEFN